MRTSRLVDNQTNMVSACATLDWIDGSEVAAVVAKATFEIDAAGRERLPLIPSPIRRSDQGETPRLGGPVYPDDIAAYKPGTDVLLVGSAVLPEGSRANKMNVSLRVVSSERIIVDKTVHVFGERKWEAGLTGIGPSSARPLRPTPLIWENTYGGHTEVDGIVQYDTRNPVGSGYGKPDAWLGRAVPPIDNPHAPIGSRAPAPAGFGPIRAGWQPRAGRHGTIDQRWRRERAPLPPEDLDVRCFSCAPDDQWSEEPLQGGELVEVQGVRASGPWAFRLPMCWPLFESVCEGVVTEYRPHVDTVLIDANEGRVELSWRVAVPLPRKTEKLERIAIHYAAPLKTEWMTDLAARYRAKRDEAEKASERQSAQAAS